MGRNRPVILTDKGNNPHQALKDEMEGQDHIEDVQGRARRQLKDETEIRDHIEDVQGRARRQLKDATEIRDRIEDVQGRARRPPHENEEQGRQINSRKDAGKIYAITSLT